MYTVQYMCFTAPTVKGEPGICTLYIICFVQIPLCTVNLEYVLCTLYVLYSLTTVLSRLNIMYRLITFNPGSPLYFYVYLCCFCVDIKLYSLLWKVLMFVICKNEYFLGFLRLNFGTVRVIFLKCISSNVSHFYPNISLLSISTISSNIYCLLPSRREKAVFL